MTVVVHLVGGLGNQLFQLAAAHHLAQQQGRDITVDVTEARLIHDRQGLLPLYEQLRTIDFNWPLPRPVNLRLARWRQTRVIAATRDPLLRHIDELEVFVDDGSAQRIHLRGIFMSRDFAAQACDVGRPLRPRLHSPTRWFAEASSDLQAKDPLALHIRRGDYLNDPSRGIITSGYYRRAVGRMRKPGQPIWVFSDDPVDAAVFLQDAVDGDVTFIKPASKTPAAEVMMLLASASTIVTCNSTFSWWSAFLSNAVVTYPTPVGPDAVSPTGTHRSPMPDPSWIHVGASYEEF